MSKKTNNKEIKIDAVKLSAIDRAEKRRAEIFTLQLDELRNGVAQGKLYYEQREEYKRDGKDGWQSLFTSFVQGCQEKMVYVEEKISRYLLIMSVPGALQQESLKYLRGTFLSELKTLNKGQVAKVASTLSKQLQNLKGTASTKTIQSKLMETARKIRNEPMTKPTPKKIKKDNSEENEPSSAGTVNTVDSVPVNLGWNIPDLEKVNSLKSRDGKEIAIKSLFRAVTGVAIGIATEPLEMISIENFSELLTLTNDCMSNLAELAKRLEFTLKKQQAA